MSTEHIAAILETQNQISKQIRKIFEDEIKFRKLIQVNKQIQKIYKDKTTWKNSSLTMRCFDL